MKLDLQWFRRRQRSLVRGVLGLFCAAWLQAAIAPCVMAHAADAAGPQVPAVQHDHGAMAAHDHGAVASGQHDGGGTPPCLYCPPVEQGSGAAACDGHGCLFPHDPQVDARAGGLLFVALPVAFVVPSPDADLATDLADAAVAEAIPRISLSVSYCRFIE